MSQDPKKRRSTFAPQSRRFTVVELKHKRIEMSKYRSIEDITGEHLDVNIAALLPPPPSYTINDWIIINLVDFLKRIELLYSSCSLFCTSDTCPHFGAGPRYNYLWLDDDSSKSLQISAPDYFDALKRYIKRNLSNKTLFPDKLKGEFSPKALNVIQNSYRRLFRMLAHLYICHFKDISQLEELEVFKIMNTVLTHYTHIALLYRVCDLDEFKVFEPIFNNINANAKPNFHCPKLNSKSIKKKNSDSNANTSSNSQP